MRRGGRRGLRAETFESKRTEHPSEPTAGPAGHAEDGSDGDGPPGSDLDHTQEYHGSARPATDPSGPLPERFGRYPVVALQDAGGFGRVYVARDDELDRPVAIKVLHPGALRDPGQVASFEAEARMAGGLTHPGIVRVYDVGHHGEGGFFVVFEYVEGRNLADILKAERPFATLAGLLSRIAEAAHYAHVAGLIHRDLKPSNILVDLQAPRTSPTSAWPSARTCSTSGRRDRRDARLHGPGASPG